MPASMTTGASAHRLISSSDQPQGASPGSPTATEYHDIPGFSKSASLEEIQKHGYVLTPGRYVGAADVEDDGEPFEEKMQRLTADLYECLAEAESLGGQIKANLEGLGYGS